MSVDILRELSQFDLGRISPPSKEVLAGVDGNSLQGLSQINKLSETIFREDPLFQAARQVLGTDQASQARVRRAVSVQDFPEDREEYGPLLTAASIRQEIARRGIIQSLDRGGSFGLQPFEQEVLRTSCRVGRYFDELGIFWTRDVRFNPDNAKANELGLKNPYTVIEGDQDQYRQVAWATKYPDQIQPITEQFKDLSRRLEGEENEEARGLAGYFGSYNEALKEENPAELERVWEQARERWMVYQGRVQPVANDRYHDPNRLRAFPGFSLLVEVPGSNEPLEMTRRAMAKHLGRRYGSLSSFQATSNILERSRVSVVAQAVTAGSLDLIFAGLSDRTADSAKVFVNPERVEDRFNQAKNLFSKVFRSKSDRKLVDEIELPLTVIGTTFAGHEFGEGLFLSEEVEKALGEKTIADLHEGLADLTIAASIRDAIKAGDLPARTLLQHVARNLTFCLSRIAQEESTHLQSYTRNALSWLRRMTESGFINEGLGGWHINPEEAGKLYDLVEQDLDMHVRIAETKDSALAALYLAQTEVTQAIADLIATVKQASGKGF